MKARLRRALLPVDQHGLTAAILKFLELLPKKSSRKEKVARNLAVYLGNYDSLSKSTKQLERLIENSPLELDRLIDQQQWKELREVMKLAKPGWKRKRAANEKERALRKRLAKERHDRKRSVATARGFISIEEDFSAAPTAADFHRSLFDSITGLTPLPTQPRHRCLDVLFLGGGVPLAAGKSSLQSLFRVGRKSLPSKLPSIRAGRAISYDYRALVQCMEFLLEQGTWLPARKTRQLVLSAVVHRARVKGLPHIRAAVEKSLSPYIV